MPRLAQHRDEAGRLVEHLVQPRAVLRQFARGAHPPGRFRHDAQHAADAAVVQRHRRIGDVEIHLLAISRALDVERPVLRGIGFAGGAHMRQQRLQIVPQFRPGLARRAAERGGMLVPDRRRIGIVVQRDLLRAPEQHDLRLRGQHHRQRVAQHRRPVLYRPQRRGGPVMRGDPPPHVAAAHRECQGIARSGGGLCHRRAD